MSNLIKSLEASLYHGFINEAHEHAGNYRPKLLVNQSTKNEDVLTSIRNEMENCRSFLFSVAFITESGLATLKSLFLDLKQKGVTGRILTSTYLIFNHPKVFRELMKITNVRVRLASVKGFHAKGYIFEHDAYYSLIVGSSNLTAQALQVNYEWNIKLTSHENGEIVHHFKNQFEEVWANSEILTEEWIEQYEKTYAEEKKTNEQVYDFPVGYQTNPIQEALKIQPNKMQDAALKEIQALRDEGKNKGLVISATGTGKTYLSAFDVRRFAPKKMLFIVHREQILQKAMKDFQLILGGLSHEFGILSGTSKQTDAKYIFATIQMLSKDDTLYQFATDEFDYILVDEVHKAGAMSYRKVINYFQPKFLMGMTATPERTDDFNIYELFDYNIAYEIRLQEALEEDMLCPFHYFGVRDFQYNGQTIDDATALSHLVADERVDHIIDKITYYGYSGDSVKGLMFCSRKKEAKHLSVLLNARGLRTVALTGDDSQEERIRCVTQLENGLLDYILTVDIFNEGIDIPCINQIVMLRQTQSSIIFIQQLGRGLRKHDTKDYVTIIDFIGNYKNNYLIPIALSGDQSQNKDNVRRRMVDTSYIKGVSTINFEAVARKQIFKAINNCKLNAAKILKESYIGLKNRIGRVPYLYDFIINHSIDPCVIVEANKNYDLFLRKMRENKPGLSTYENQVLTMLSLEILNGKRKHEIILLERLLGQGTVTEEEYVAYLRKNGCMTDGRTMESIRRIFNLQFFTEVDRKKYGNQPIVLFEENQYKFNAEIRNGVAEHPYFRMLVEDVVMTAEEKSKEYECGRALKLYEKYTRKDVCRLLNWSNDEHSTMYGYKSKHNTCPIFVTYDKKEDVDSSVNYEDELLNPEVLKWYTKSNRTLKSQEVKSILEADQNHTDIHIFIKKSDDEGTGFYYLGRAHPDQNTAHQTVMARKNLPVVCMNMILEQSVEDALYHYLTSNIDAD